MMELKTFITQALLDIVHGVADAQQQSGNAKIVPSTKVAIDHVQTGLTPYQLVKFEVCVRVDESKGSEGKIGVVSAFIGAGLAGKSSNESGHSTTIQFSVPILLPTHHDHESLEKKRT